MTSSYPQPRWIAALLLLLVFHGVILTGWARKDTMPLAWDQAIHTKIAFEYRDRLAHGSFWSALRPVDMNYPPLYHLSMVPMLARVSDVADAGIAVNLFYLLVLVSAVFFTGNKLMGPWEGFTAAVLIGCYPAINFLAHNVLIDLSLAAWVSVAFFFLLGADNFSNPIGSLFFGAALGLAMLTKWTALGYLLVPLVPAVWTGIRGRHWLNLALAAVVTSGIMYPWYLQNFIPMLIRIPKLSGLPPASAENLTGLGRVFWYPLSLSEQMSLPFLVLLLPGLIAFFWRPKLTPVLLWFFGSMVLFSLITNKNIRYFAPALPAAALLSVSWLPAKRPAIFSAVIAFAALIFVAANVISGRFVSFMAGNQRLWIFCGRTPQHQDWRHNDIIDKIIALKKPGVSPADVVVVSNHPYFHSTTLNMSERVRNLRDVSFHGPSKQRWFEFADFVLLKTGDLGPAFTLGTINQCAAAIAGKGSWFGKIFKEAARWPLPDGSEAILYRADPDKDKHAQIDLFNLTLGQLDMPNVHATGVELKAVPLSSADSSVGRLKELRVRCKTISYKNIPFRDVEVRLVEPQINLPLFYETQEIQMVSLKALEPHATVAASTLLDYAAEKAKWLKEPKIEFNGPLIKISGRVAGLPLDIQAEVKVDGPVLTTRARRVAVGGIPVPLVLLRALTDQTIQLTRNDEWSYDLNLARVDGQGNALRVGL